MRTGADHTILEQSTKVSALGIIGSNRHVNCACHERGNKWICNGTYSVHCYYWRPEYCL